MAKQKNQYNVHHRKPLGSGGLDVERNKSEVRKSHHQAYHQMFGLLPAYKIADYLNKKWIDPDFYFFCIKREDIAIVEEALSKKELSKY